jgi:hypothetical protein
MEIDKIGMLGSPTATTQVCEIDDRFGTESDLAWVGRIDRHDAGFRSRRR